MAALLSLEGCSRAQTPRIPSVEERNPDPRDPPLYSEREWDYKPRGCKSSDGAGSAITWYGSLDERLGATEKWKNTIETQIIPIVMSRCPGVTKTLIDFGAHSPDLERGFPVTRVHVDFSRNPVRYSTWDGDRDGTFVRSAYEERKIRVQYRADLDAGMPRVEAERKRNAANQALEQRRADARARQDAAVAVRVGAVSRPGDYWGQYHRGPVLDEVFHGRLRASSKNREHDVLYTHFIAGYWRVCGSHLPPGAPGLRWTYTTTTVRGDGAVLGQSEESVTVQMQPRYFESFKAANARKEDWERRQAVATVAGMLRGNGIEREMNTTLRLMLEPKQDAEAFISKEGCTSKATDQMIENLHRAASDQAPLQAGR